MNGFLAALQFLTIIPLKQDSQKLARATIFFPFVGAFLGILLILLNNCLFIIFPEPLISLTLVSFLLVVTGALHLDGLADTIDGLFGGKNKEERLSIMRDSHRGTFGALGLIIIILFKITLLSLIPRSFKNFALFIMPILSRYAMVLAISLFPYAREDGKAKIFFEQKKIKTLLLASLGTFFLLSLTLKWVGVLSLFLTFIFTLIIGIFIKRAIEGLTGDTLGAISELNEAFVLLFVFVCS